MLIIWSKQRLIETKSHRVGIGAGRTCWKKARHKSMTHKAEFRERRKSR